MGWAYPEAQGVHAVRPRRNRRADVCSPTRSRPVAVRASPSRCLRKFRNVFRRKETSMEQKLKGRRIAALAADGVEKVELVIPMKALKAAGAAVDVISLRHGNIRGVNLHEPASRVHVDKT